MIEIPKKEPLNIVPFIDIMLVLLAMVLSISTFIAKGEIEMNLPGSKSASAPAQAQASPMLLQVDAGGAFYVDGKPASLEEIAKLISGLQRDERVLLRIDKNAPFERFIELVDLLRAHEHENFSIAAEKTNG